MPPPTEDRLRVARELVERRDRLLAENELLETHATRLKPAGDDAAVRAATRMAEGLGMVPFHVSGDRR